MLITVYIDTPTPPTPRAAPRKGNDHNTWCLYAETVMTCYKTRGCLWARRYQKMERLITGCHPYFPPLPPPPLLFFDPSHVLPFSPVHLSHIPVFPSLFPGVLPFCSCLGYLRLSYRVTTAIIIDPWRIGESAATITPIIQLLGM